MPTFLSLTLSFPIVASKIEPNVYDNTINSLLSIALFIPLLLVVRLFSKDWKTAFKNLVKLILYFLLLVISILAIVLIYFLFLLASGRTLV